MIAQFECGDPRCRHAAVGARTGPRAIRFGRRCYVTSCQKNKGPARKL